VPTRVWPLSRGAGVTVAVLDSGVQANVADLRGAVVPGGDTTGAGTSGETDDDYSADGHGTAMAALIAGQGRGGGIAGIAPAAKIMPVRVGGLDGVPPGGTPDTVAAGILFAVRDGAAVVNLSLGAPAVSASSCDTVEQDAVSYALRRDVVVVASAGDSQVRVNNPEQPASCAGVLAVGAVNPDLTVWPQSQQQSYVAVAAPGNDIGWSGSDGRYFPDGYGTSQAAAFVSGEAALIRSRYPAMRWQQVVARVIGTALPRGRRVPNDKFGYGIVQLSSALDRAHFPLRHGSPDPVYAAFRRWLASPHPGSASQVAAAARARGRRLVAAVGTGSSSAAAGLAIVLGAVTVLAAAVAAALVLARRRTRARARRG